MSRLVLLTLIVALGACSDDSDGGCTSLCGRACAELLDELGPFDVTAMRFVVKDDTDCQALVEAVRQADAGAEIDGAYCEPGTFGSATVGRLGVEFLCTTDLVEGPVERSLAWPTASSSEPDGAETQRPSRGYPTMLRSTPSSCSALARSL